MDDDEEREYDEDYDQIHEEYSGSDDSGEDVEVSRETQARRELKESGRQDIGEDVLGQKSREQVSKEELLKLLGEKSKEEQAKLLKCPTPGTQQCLRPARDKDEDEDDDKHNDQEMSQWQRRRRRGDDDRADELDAAG